MAALALLAALTVAQTSGVHLPTYLTLGGPRRSDAVLNLLVIKRVQNDLKITEDQLRGFQAVTGKEVIWGPKASYRESFQPGRDYFKVDENLVALLNQDQRRRLGEIWLQTYGAGALPYRNMADALALTSAQSHRIVDLNLERSHKLRPWGATTGPDVFALNARINREYDERLLGVLTPDQRKKFESLKGKPFAWGRSIFRPGRF